MAVDEIQTEDQAIEEFSKEFERLQSQKARPGGGIEPRVLLNVAFGMGEQYTVYQNKTLLTEPQDANKLSLMFNLVDARVGKLMGRLSSLGGTFKANPDKRSAKAMGLAEVVDRLIKALDQIVDQPSVIREHLFWLLYGGTSFEYVTWEKNATVTPVPQFGAPTPESPTGELMFKDLVQSQVASEPTIVPKSVVDQQVAAGRPPESFEPYEVLQAAGEVGSRVFGPLQVFVDQGVKSIEALAPDQSVMVAFIKTHGWIEENYPGATEDLESDTDLRIVTTNFELEDRGTVAGMSLKDLIPIIQGSRDEDDPEMNVVVERYQPASANHPNGRFTCFIPNKKILYDGDNPYGEIPIVDIHFKPVTTSFWTKDYVTDLIAPQRFINKRMSQLGEQANASIYDKVLLGPGLTPKDIPSDYPGLVINGVAENGAPLVQRLPGPQLPGWFMNSIDLTLKLFDQLAGGADLLQEHQFPGQLRGPMAVPMLQEIIDSEWGPFFEHLGERLAKIKQMRLNRVKKFYPPLRTMHYMDRTQKDEVFEFHAEDVLRSGIDFNITVERGSLLPELRALREARVRERLASPLSILYIDDRIGRLDKSKIAADLNYGDTGRESQEAQYRKLGAEVVDRLWAAKPVPPVMPFYRHDVMMDELEHAMATTEFMEASPPLQQMFFQRWQQHQQFLQQAADNQAQAAAHAQMQGAISQGVQQASAEAAAATVKMALPALQAQVDGAAGVPNVLRQAFGKVQA